LPALDVDSTDEIGRLIAQCDAKVRLKLNGWARQVQMYFRSLRAEPQHREGLGDTTGTQEHICNTYERKTSWSIHYGMARFVFLFGLLRQAAQGARDLIRFLERRRAHSRAHGVRERPIAGISHSVRPRRVHARGDAGRRRRGIERDVQRRLMTIVCVSSR